MKKTSSDKSEQSQKNKSQVQLNSSFRQNLSPSKNNFLTPKKQQKQRIFVQTPTAVYIPISQKQEQNFNQINKPQNDGNLDNKDETKKKSNIFDKNNNSQNKIFSKESSTLTSLNLQKKYPLSNIAKSKTTISFKKERISQFFYYQNFIVCKGLRKVIVYNFFSKVITHIPLKYDQFVMTSFPPYVFNCITGQYLNLYSEAAVQKYTLIQRKKQESLRQKQRKKQENDKYKIANNNPKDKSLNPSEQKIQQQTVNFDRDWELTSTIEVTVIKISKLEVECICKYGQTIYMGGYNRSILPGGKKSDRRQIYLMDHLDQKINNKPQQIIKISPSNYPISIIQVQMPYLIVYCRPNFYIFALKTHQLLLTFQKELKMSILLEGRFALNVINGIGISTRGPKHNIFTYDIENTPIFGVQITQHKQQATCICLQKTGRIFGCHKSALFEYIPTKRITRCVKIYSQAETILWIESTPNNNLLVLRQTQNLQYWIQAFSIDQNSISDF